MVSIRWGELVASVETYIWHRSPSRNQTVSSVGMSFTLKWNLFRFCNRKISYWCVDISLPVHFFIFVTKLEFRFWLSSAILCCCVCVLERHTIFAASRKISYYVRLNIKGTQSNKQCMEFCQIPWENVTVQFVDIDEVLLMHSRLGKNLAMHQF